MTVEELNGLPKSSKYVVDCFDSVLEKMRSFLPHANLHYLEDDEEDDDDGCDYYEIRSHRKDDTSKSNRIVDDNENSETFGADTHEKVMSVDEFIKLNAKIEHRAVSHYNGNPQTFGESEDEEEQMVQLNPVPYKHYLQDGDASFSFDYAKLLNCFR